MFVNDFSNSRQRNDTNDDVDVASSSPQTKTKKRTIISKIMPRRMINRWIRQGVAEEEGSSNDTNVEAQDEQWIKRLNSDDDDEEEHSGSSETKKAT